MAEVTTDLMYELLKSIDQDMERLQNCMAEVRQELVSVRLPLKGIQNDTHDIYGILARHEERLARIESRLELRELAEPHRPFDPQ